MSLQTILQRYFNRDLSPNVQPTMRLAEPWECKYCQYAPTCHAIVR